MDILALTAARIEQRIDDLTKSIEKHTVILASERECLKINRQILKALQRIAAGKIRIKFSIALRRDNTRKGAVFVRRSGDFSELLKLAL